MRLPSTWLRVSDSVRVNERMPKQPASCSMAPPPEPAVFWSKVVPVTAATHWL